MVLSQKKRVIWFSLLFFGLVFSLQPFTALAKQTLGDASSALDAVVAPTGIEKTDTATIAGTAVKGILGAIGLVFFILMFYAGFTWMLARGEEDKVTKARETIIAAVIGLVIVVGSYAITNLVVQKIILDKSGGGSLDGTGDAPNVIGGGGTLVCCITPATSNLFSQKTMMIGTEQDCEAKAKETVGDDYGSKKGTDGKWNMYPGVGTAACSDILSCWTSSGSTLQCLNNVLTKSDLGSGQEKESWCLTPEGNCVSGSGSPCPGQLFSTQNQCNDGLKAQENNDSNPFGSGQAGV